MKKVIIDPCLSLKMIVSMEVKSQLNFRDSYKFRDMQALTYLTSDFQVVSEGNGVKLK